MLFSDGIATSHGRKILLVEAIMNLLSLQESCNNINEVAD